RSTCCNCRTVPCSCRTTRRARSTASRIPLPEESRIVRVFFGALWRGLDGLRKFLHLVLLLLIFGIIVGALRSTIPVLPDKAALVVRPEGEIVEQLTGDPFERALEKVQGTLRSETLLWDLTDAIDAARDDDRVQALVLDLDRFTGAGQPA